MARGRLQHAQVRELARGHTPAFWQLLRFNYLIGLQDLREAQYSGSPRVHHSIASSAAVAQVVV